MAAAAATVSAAVAFAVAGKLGEVEGPESGLPLVVAIEVEVGSTPRTPVRIGRQRSQVVR